MPISAKTVIQVILDYGNCFRSVRKIAKSVCWVRHVRSLVHMKQLDSLWTNFEKIWFLNFFFQKYVEKSQVLLKSDKNNKFFTKRRFYIYNNISLNSC